MRNASFTPLGYSYYAREGAAYWGGVRIPRADLATFVPLSHRYAVDANRVYCQDAVLRGADRASFRVLNALYAKDADNVWWYASKVKQVDAQTFEAVGPDFDGSLVRGYARDREHVFHAVATIGKPSIVKAAVASSFRGQGHGFGTDGHRVFYERSQLTGAQPASWRYLGAGYSRDDVRIYHGNQRLRDADVATFQVLPASAHFARDAHRVYWNDSSCELEEYLDELRDLHVMLGAVRDACVLDERGDPTDRSEIAPETEQQMRLTLACEAWIQHPSDPPLAGSGASFDVEVRAPGTVTDWHRRRGLWLFHRAGPDAPPSLRGRYVLAHGWQDFVEPTFADPIRELIAR